MEIEGEVETPDCVDTNYLGASSRWRSASLGVQSVGEHGDVVLVVNTAGRRVLGDSQEGCVHAPQLAVRHEITIADTVQLHAPSISLSRNGVPLVVSNSRMTSASM